MTTTTRAPKTFFMDARGGGYLEVTVEDEVITVGVSDVYGAYSEIYRDCFDLSFITGIDCPD
jgi:hypothetical protein